MHPLYLFLTALAGSLVFVPVLRYWAIKRGVLDQPGERKVHSKAVPRLGGIGVYLAFLLAVLLHDDLSVQMIGLLLGSLLLFATGVLDDLYGLKARYKFLGQIAGCLLTITLGGLSLTSLGTLLSSTELIIPSGLVTAFTIFAVVGVINAMNFLDGLDGMAGGVTLIALAAFFLLGLQGGNMLVMTASAAFAGATLGFMPYNRYPASIFMGDTGSLLAGFMLGFLAIGLTQSKAIDIPPIVPMVILGLPVLDALWVMTVRIGRRKNPFSPDNSHIHHGLLKSGLHHRTTVWAIYGISLLSAVIAIVFRQIPDAVLFYGYSATMLLFFSVLRFRKATTNLSRV